MNAAPPQVKEALAASVPFPKRLGNPEEYAKLAVCMIETGYFNGEDVRLDGGDPHGAALSIVNGSFETGVSAGSRWRLLYSRR